MRRTAAGCAAVGCAAAAGLLVGAVAVPPLPARTAPAVRAVLSPSMALAQAPPGLRVAARRALARAGTAASVDGGKGGSHEPGDLFGDAVALSGSTAVVGAWGVNNDAGAVYVFVRSRGTWHQQAKIADPAHAGAGFFGFAVAVSGATAVIGANGVGNNAGAAYVYVRSKGAWHRQASLADPGGPDADFGDAVAVSGGTAIVDAQGVNGNAGAAYIYVRSGGAWHRQATLADPVGAAVDDFGSELALSGGIAVFSAGNLSGQRVAYIYQRSGSTWRRQAKLADPAPKASDFYGDALAVWGTTVVVGAWGARKSAGVVYVYALSGTGWRRQATLASPGGSAPDEFGSAVSVSRTALGLRLLVGAPNGQHGCGDAYIFARSGRAWREKAKVANPGGASPDAFGHAVALSGRTAVIGAPGKHDNAGAVYELIVP